MREPDDSAQRVFPVYQLFFEIQNVRGCKRLEFTQFLKFKPIGTVEKVWLTVTRLRKRR